MPHYLHTVVFVLHICFYILGRLQRGFFKVSHCHSGTENNSQPWFPPQVMQSFLLTPFSSPLPPLLPPSSVLARGQVGHLVMVVVVRANLLDQAVVRTVEGNVDTDDLERLGANPGHMALNLFLEAGLGRVVVAQRGALAAVHLLIVHAAVEDLGVLGVDHALAL